MEVFLHVGAHRTATTTLQRMLGQSHDAMAAARLIYWGPKRTRGGLFQGLIGQSEALRPWQVKRTADRVRLRLQQHRLDGARGVFVSEENILGTMREMVDQARLYPDVTPRVARFLEGVSGYPATIALAIRPYDAFWASVLAFRLTRGGTLPHPRLAESLVSDDRTWRDVIGDLSAACPEAKILVWDYTALAHRPDMVVSRIVGQNLRLSGADARLNSSPELASLRCYLDDCGEDPDLIPTAAGRFMPFDVDQRAVLGARYKADLDWLAAGADGLASYLQAPAMPWHLRAEDGKGSAHDGDIRRLA